MRRGRGRRIESSGDVAAEVERKDRRFEALRLRVGGMSSRAVGRALGISHTQAQKDIKQAISDRGQETAEELRAMSNEALEAVLEGHLEAARQGDPKSARVVIGAIAEHARINGYEAPAKVEHTGKDGGPIETRSGQDEVLGRLSRIFEQSKAEGAVNGHSNGVSATEPGSSGASDPEPNGNGAA